jgi:GNAT superfamily N-acetyltransferase
MATRELVVRTADHPELVPVVARWVWEAFWREGGYPLDHVLGLVGASVANLGPPQTFVLLIDGKPVGTASLVAQDWDERPDLTPWLAGVFVTPETRGRGYVKRLITAVEDACRTADISSLWLYTATAERIYLRAGWQTISKFDRGGEVAALMGRTLRNGGERFS